MKTDQQVIDEIWAAFGIIEKPQRFHPDVGDPEFEEHNQLLLTRNRETLERDELNPGWDPFCSCSPEGIAYYFPRLTQFALEKPKVSWQWYAEQLLFHLTYQGKENRFLKFCNANQRVAVASLIMHIVETRSELVNENLSSEEFDECLSLWKAEAKRP